MSSQSFTSAAAAPARWLLRPAGVLTQIASAFSLLLGTIAFVLVATAKTGGVPLVAVWAAAAMLGLVLGGLMARGGMIAVVGGAVVDIAFGVALLVIPWETLRALLRLLPESDVTMIANILVGFAIGQLVIGAMALASIGQARRYNRALRAAEDEAEKSGIWEMPMAPVPSTIPAAAPPPPEQVRPSQLDPRGTQQPGQFAAGPPSMPAPLAGVPQGIPDALGRISSPDEQGIRMQTAPPGAIPSLAGAQVRQSTMPGAMSSTLSGQSPGPMGSSPMGSTMPGRPATLPPGFAPPSGGMGASSSGSMPRQSQLPLPPPPPSRDGYSPPARIPQPSPIQLPPGYLPSGDGGMAPPTGMEPPASAETAPGWQPAPVKTHRTTMMIVRSPAQEKKSRRRVYIALGGFAIGLGCGVGVLVSSANSPAKKPTGATMKVSSSDPKSPKESTPTTPSAPTKQSTPTVPTANGSGSGATGSGATGSGATGSGATGSGATGSGGTTPTAGETKPPAQAQAMPAPDTLLSAQRALIAKGDVAGLAATFATNAFAIGIDAEEVAEGRDAITPMLKHDLGDAPPGGFTVTSRFQTIGTEGNHAWTAEELELSGSGIASRRIAITQLAAFVNGQWTVVAAHWGRPVADATAERLAILGTLPQPRQMPSRADDAALGKAVAAAFASRSAFAEARSERPDGFNFGSGPNERIVGGAKIKALFARLKSQMRIDGGARVVGGAAWDSTQSGGAWIGFAALNVVYTQKSRAQTDVNQTFRVLAVLLREQDRWTIVQTQFSNAGPIND